ncbi:MAG TPA: hypothetical protein VL857_05365 [Candidatus Eisenbacteria bacterium]|jgi:hypothetical protein|nr:hypothetical protein [Candidatus Eisenbacteria bacterium]
MSKSSVEQAELMLHLYEMRREPEMRRARHHVMHEFKPTTWDELRYLSGDDGDRWFRMVTSYWEMVASMVNRGFLDEDLFFDTQGEGLFVWLRVKEIVPEGRKNLRPTWLWNLEQMAIRQQAWREKTYVGVDKTIADGSKLKGSKAAKKMKKAAKR